MRAQLVAIAFVLGCGGDGGVNINTDQNNVCGEVAEVACHNLYQCCSEGEIERFLGVSDPRSEGECRDDISRLCDRAIASRNFGIDQKHVRFDAKIMNDCLDALVAPSDTCATIASELPWSEACLNSAWIGLVDNGGACLSTSECASKDSFCGANQTCVALPGDGQPCAFGVASCATGLFCSTGTCRPRAAAGGACTSSAGCLAGLFCNLTVAPAVCTTLHAPGEACTGNASCTSNQCNPGACAGTSQTCFVDTSCQGRCADDQSLCGNDGQCMVGTCSIGGTACFGPEGCVGAGNVCNLPVRCVHDACVGSVVCAERHLVVDYCQGALGDLPIP